jgi:glucose-6-phosphate isomerase
MFVHASWGGRGRGRRSGSADVLAPTTRAASFPTVRFPIPPHTCPPPPAGNRPSTSLLLPSLTPFRIGQLLALYENRVATQVGGPQGP